MRLVADDYVGQYVRVVYNFQSSEKGEIPLVKGDVFRVTSAIDNNWLYGKVWNQEGTFPCSYVEKVSLPAVQGREKIYAATENFPAQQKGDLEFRKGELILGMWEIDENWWHGKLGNKEGMFPLTHVAELEIPKLLRQRSKSVHSKDMLFARALCDSVAQLDEELGFQAGDIISVIEVMDADWYVGELSGKRGMFLSSCVELLNEERSPSPTNTHGTITKTSYNDVSVNKNDENVTTSRAPPQHGFDPTVMSYTSENTKSHDSSVTPYARTIYSFVGEMSNELSFNANDIVTLIQHVDDHWIEGELDGKIGIFPSNYVEIVVDCPYISRMEHTYSLDSMSNIQQDYCGADTSLEQSQCAAEDISKSFSQKRYGLVRHSFPAQTKGDLNLHEGDTVTVLKQIDDNWIEAKDENGNVGICPVDFVELIAVEPDSLKTNGFQIAGNKGSSKIGTNGLDRSSCDTVKNLASKDCDISEGVMPLTKQVTFSNSEPRSAAFPALPQKSYSMDIRKPPIKPKPKLPPKPFVKPKPVLVKQNHVPPPVPDQSFTPKLHDVTIDVKEPPKPFCEPIDSISRSESCHAFTHNLSAESTASVQRASSLSKLDNDDSKSLCHQPSNQKAFNSVDLNESLESIEQNQLTNNQLPSLDNIKNENSKLPPLDDIHVGSYHSSVSTTNKETKRDHFNSQNNDPWIGASSSVEIDNNNSKFYTGRESDIYTHPKPLQMRKPPPIPKRTDTIELNFERKPSLRKAAPPRPTGPKLAPAPSNVPLTPVKVKPVPQREAPPPPTGSTHLPGKLPGYKHAVVRHHAQKSVVKSEPPDIQRSSFYVNEISLDDEDTPLVTDLKKRIMDMEKDLENCRKSRQELKQTLLVVEPDSMKEVEENIEFYDANISGLSDELIKLKDDLKEIYSEEQEDAKRKADEARKIEEEIMEKEVKKHHEESKLKNQETRQNVIREIIQTEKKFLFSLQLGITTFLESAADGDQPPDVDVETMFGNMEEITDVSQRLLTKLEEAVFAKDFGEQIIGPCFMRLAEDMKNAYAPYCRNHDEVITLLEKYDSSMEIKDFFERILNKLREQMILFDIGALLIKPVQRILKYPLLLNELMKATEEDHPDKVFVQQAITEMTDVATAINEYKRRKDLVYKYKKDSDTKFGEKLAKLSLHTIKKKSSRLRERLSTNLGIALQTKDEAYDKEEAQFRSLEKMVKIYIRDVNVCLEQMQETVLAQENFAEDLEKFYSDISCPEVNKYVEVSRQIADIFFIQFHDQVSEQILSPLGKLTQTFDGPINVMQKRFDKLLDYDILLKKARDADKMQDKALNTARITYEALNAQLLDELPQLYRLSLQLLQDCIATFVLAQRQYIHNILQHMSPLLDLPLLLSSGENVIDAFNFSHVSVVDRLSTLSFIPKGFNPRVEMKQDKRHKRMSLDPQMVTPAASPSTPQSDSQKAYLRQLYLPDRLYHVIQDYAAVDLMDLPVFSTDLVGLIKQQDPMGNKNRWFVDTGARKGFVPRKVLALYQSSPSHSCDLSSTDGQSRATQYSQAKTLSSGNLQDSVYDVPSISVCHTEKISGQDTPQTPPKLSSVYDTPYMYRTMPSPNASAASLCSMNEMDIENDDVEFALEEEMLPDITDVEVSSLNSSADDNLYFAEYSFESRSDNEVSLFERQVVTVLLKHDLEGNQEWWLVDADGTQGYAPAIYLHKMAPHDENT